MIPGCPSIDTWYRGVPRNTRLPTTIGFSVLFVWLAGFGAWAAIAPLASAVVTSGHFVAIGQNKQIQHLEGGIISELLVKEGDVVEANQNLVRLDDTSAKSKLRRLVLRKYRLIATTARLNAELAAAAQIELPPELKEQLTDPAVRSIVDAQTLELKARRNSLEGQEKVLRKEIAGLHESIGGYQAQVTSGESRRALFLEELEAKSTLLERQLVKRSEILALMRSEVGLSGELGELLGRIGDAKEKIARAEQQIVQLRTAAAQKAIEELHTATAELDDVQEQILAAHDVVERTDVRAPVRGIVVKLHHHTAGGVINAGGILLELLPINDELLIQARIKPSDVAHVREGQQALVRLSALNQRVIPMVEGTVTYLSADAVPEQVVGRPQEQEAAKGVSFVVRVRLDQNDLASKVESFQPTPGMPADLFIETGERTFFDYLMRPLLDSFMRAFREH
ncbi:MAG: HlyD family type I secretion periplasmic adaptor subunit [Rhizobiales bacterium]|nr:HlyD family type I secretion periplasmic adaptor subunit [Hyphomicrobiales bacterium]